MTQIVATADQACQYPGLIGQLGLYAPMPICTDWVVSTLSNVVERQKRTHDERVQRVAVAVVSELLTSFLEDACRDTSSARATVHFSDRETDR